MLILDLTPKLFIYSIYDYFAAIAVSKQSKNSEKYMHEIIWMKRLYVCRGMVIRTWQNNYLFLFVFQNIFLDDELGGCSQSFVYGGQFNVWDIRPGATYQKSICMIVQNRIWKSPEGHT